jgi:hypothetical protein
MTSYEISAANEEKSARFFKRIAGVERESECPDRTAAPSLSLPTTAHVAGYLGHNQTILDHLTIRGVVVSIAKSYPAAGGCPPTFTGGLAEKNASYRMT